LAAAGDGARAADAWNAGRVFMSYPVSRIDGIGPDEIKALKRIGIRTTEGLLEAAKSPKGRKQLAAQTGLDEKCLLKWANSADRMRIKGVGDDYSQLILAAGVDTVRELKHRNAKRLTEAMRNANAKRKVVDFLPSEKAVTRWIEHAKKLPLKITY
jgi:predicted RecB family nuclease